jgi:hypothetical protein
MSTATQIEANRKNAQASTGPGTEAGKQKSSLNATSHSFTGQQIVLSAEEKVAYDTHCIAYLEQYQPKTHEENDLIQQYADQEWTLHQISVQQINVLALMNLTIARLMNEGVDLDTYNAVTAPFYKQLSTLGIYENRRRRAAATLASFQELAAQRQDELAEAAQTCTTLKAQGKPFNPQEFGFVHSLPEIEAFLARAARRADAMECAPKLRHGGLCIQ